MKRISRTHIVVAITGLIGLVFPDLVCAEETNNFKARDGLLLESTWDLPAGVALEDSKRIIILVHGSGSHSMDADLTVVTAGKRPNLFFKTVGEALSHGGFSVFRYHKRPYQLARKIKEDASQAKSDFASSYRDNPVRFHINDLLDAVQHVRQQCPKAAIYLLGHSEGTYTALQAMNESTLVDGVGLIGFAQYSTDLLLFEQMVNRPLIGIRRLDSDTNESLSDSELNDGSQIAGALSAQKGLLDQNGDGQISWQEIQAANLANLMVNDIGKAFREEEARLPRASDIVLASTKPVVFFQGMLDNQTPAYHALALQLLAKQTKRSKHLDFHFFPGLGHALDARREFTDLEFDLIDEQALATIVEVLQGKFPAAQ